MAKTADNNFGFTVAMLAAYLVVTFSMIYAHGKIAPSFYYGSSVPSGDSSVQISGELLPEGVVEAYLNNDGSMVIIAIGQGFSGDVEFIVELDSSGKYTSITMGANKETANVGGNVKNPEYLEQYYGHRDPNSIDALTGASRTSAALVEALELCNQVFDAVN
ncbi:MAG: FMN-binding protein [Oscillospiraceae bacterium]|nr:FMN-binding protein [Oscillospiraceae bacterium]